MRVNNITLRPFAYSYDSFSTCSNPHRITASDITVATEASFLLPPLTTFHHSLIHFTSKTVLQLYSAPKHISHTFHHIVPPEEIIWLSFNSITTSFDSLLFLAGRDCY